MKTLSVHVNTVLVEDGLWCHVCNSHSARRVWYTATIRDETTMRSQTVCESYQ